MPLPGGAAADAFSVQAGPDVRVNGPNGPVSMVAVFSVDPKTNEVHVAVYDDKGLVRVIPSGSVFEMVSMMRGYHP